MWLIARPLDFNPHNAKPSTASSVILAASAGDAARATGDVSTIGAASAGYYRHQRRHKLRHCHICHLSMCVVSFFIREETGVGVLRHRSVRQLEIFRLFIQSSAVHHSSKVSSIMMVFREDRPVIHLVSSCTGMNSIRNTLTRYALMSSNVIQFNPIPISSSYSTILVADG